MKNDLKTICVAGLCLLFFSPLVAQNRVGLRAGVNIAEQTYDVESFVDLTTKSIVAPNAAFMIEIALNDKLAFQPEISYLQKGFKTGENNIFFGDFVARLNYVEVPLLLKYKFSSEGVAFFLLGGPAAGYALSGKTKEDGESSKIEDWSEYRRFEIGAHLGGGLWIPSGNGAVCIDVRILWGLSNLNKAEDDDSKVRNQGLGISLGYFFGRKE
ncbi:MAG: PorT family protein [Bacteroidetes bacterium]|nr:MAG: PorT family protein [Bacteroidota bacterium]